MTNLPIKVAFMLFYWILTISMSSAHYCVWGLCDPLEYCCEDNTCCKSEQYDMFFIGALMLGIASIVMISCACLYCNIRKIQTILPQRYFGITYVTMRSNLQTQPVISATSVREKNKDSCII